MELFPGLLPVRAHGHQMGMALRIGDRGLPSWALPNVFPLREPWCAGDAAVGAVDALLYSIVMPSGEDFLERRTHARRGEVIYQGFG